jgi:glutamate transport system substrate-binding protein
MKRASRLPAKCAAGIVAMATACSSNMPPSADPNPPIATNINVPANSTMAQIRDRGRITIGTKFDQPMFGLKNPATGKPQGFDVEIAKLIAAKLGIPAHRIDWVETASANREQFVQQHRVDAVIATYRITDNRKRLINFAGPYYMAGQSLMVKTGNSAGIHGPDDLAGKDVCTVEGSESSTTIRKVAPAADVVLFDSFSKCADALENGQVQAVTTDDTILAGLRSLDPGGFELVGAPFTKEPYGIGIAKGREDFVHFVNLTLQQSFDDGEWAAAWNRTAGKILGPAHAPPNLDSPGQPRKP